MRATAASFAALLACGCGSDGPRVCATPAALYYGEPDPALFGIDSRAAEAIGVVTDTAAPPGFLCTGILVGNSTVLTASHCIRGGQVSFRVGSHADMPQAIFAAREVLEHPSLDLAVLQLTAAQDLASRVPILAEQLHDGWIGREVVLSGFGQTEGGDGGEREFLREEVLAVDADSLTVWGQGRSGACGGDSGGPLLVVGRDDVPAVIGVLSKGSPSCQGIDVYVRLDAALSWLATHGAESMQAAPGCTM